MTEREEERRGEERRERKNVRQNKLIQRIQTEGTTMAHTLDTSKRRQQRRRLMQGGDALPSDGRHRRVFFAIALRKQHNMWGEGGLGNGQQREPCL